MKWIKTSERAPQHYNPIVIWLKGKWYQANFTRIISGGGFITPDRKEFLIQDVEYWAEVEEPKIAAK